MLIISFGLNHLSFPVFGIVIETWPAWNAPKCVLLIKNVRRAHGVFLSALGELCLWMSAQWDSLGPFNRMPSKHTTKTPNERPPLSWSPLGSSSCDAYTMTERTMKLTNDRARTWLLSELSKVFKLCLLLTRQLLTQKFWGRYIQWVKLGILGNIRCLWNP